MDVFYFPQPITGGNPLEQPLVYEVNYNGTMQNVTSTNTTLTFTAPSLPDGEFDGKITVTVTAINRLGHGVPSDPEYAVISKLHHTYICTVGTYCIIVTYVRKLGQHLRMYSTYVRMCDNTRLN